MHNLFKIEKAEKQELSNDYKTSRFYWYLLTLKRYGKRYQIRTELSEDYVGFKTGTIWFKDDSWLDDNLKELKE